MLTYCLFDSEKPPSHKVDTPIIEKDLEEKITGGRRHQAFILRCPLNSNSFNLQNYLYHVLWTTEKDIIFSSKIVEYSNRNLTYLRVSEKDGEEGLKRLGVSVRMSQQNICNKYNEISNNELFS